MFFDEISFPATSFGLPTFGFGFRSATRVGGLTVGTGGRITWTDIRLEAAEGAGASGFRRGMTERRLEAIFNLTVLQTCKNFDSFCSFSCQLLSLLDKANFTSRHF